MSFDDDEWKRKNGVTQDKILTTPNIQMAKQHEEKLAKGKELGDLKSKVERSQVMQAGKADKNQQGTGGLKKDEVLSTDSRSGGRDAQKMQIRQQNLKVEVEQQQGTTEQSRKTP